MRPDAQQITYTHQIYLKIVYMSFGQNSIVKENLNILGFKYKGEYYTCSLIKMDMAIQSS